MQRSTVERPTPGHIAFQENNEETAQSQSAFILLLSDRLVGGYRGVGRKEENHDDAYRKLEVPDIEPLKRRVESSFVMRQLFRPPMLVNDIGPQEPVMFHRGSLSSLAERVYKEQSSTAAMVLIGECLFHTDPLVRVSAAIAHSRICMEQGASISVIEQVAAGEDELSQQMAKSALAHMVPNHPLLETISQSESEDEPTDRSKISLLIHGTFSSEQVLSWWQPQGDFHSFIKQKVAPDLYSNDDYFRWSGAYTDKARKLAAEDLVEWSSGQGVLNQVFAHSHGGNVAMLATKRGLKIEKLILLSCPFHRRYGPDFSNVKDVVSVRVRFDLVVLVDRLFSGARSSRRNKRIKDVLLDVWFDHSKTHDLDVWKKYDVVSKL